MPPDNHLINQSATRLPEIDARNQEVSGPPAAADTQAGDSSRPHDRVSTVALADQLCIGDVVFIRVPALPFRKVAAATASWTNHVGIVVEAAGPDSMIAESTFPISRTTRFSRFIARSAQGRVAVCRLNHPPTAEQQIAIRQAAQRRLGIFYDSGFNLHSKRQFCSRYVREVLAEATGIHAGEIESFSVFLAHTPQQDLAFWRLWYFGRIPWQRRTVTPASLLRSSVLQTVFNGYAVHSRHTSKGPDIRAFS